MGYPYGETYLERIQNDKGECERIKSAYLVLANRMATEEHHSMDFHDLGVVELFTALGEAFQYGSSVLDGVMDEYHFLDDVLEALLTPREDKVRDDAN